MHLVRIDAVSLDEGEAAVDLGQEPGDLVVLSFTDSDLAAVGQAHAGEPGLPSLRLAKLARLRHPLSVDLYVERVVARARVVVIRCLGGLDYWRYGDRALRRGRAGARRRPRGPAGRRPAGSAPRLLLHRSRPRRAARRLFPGRRARQPAADAADAWRSDLGADGPIEPPVPLPRGFPWCPGCGVLPLGTALAAAGTAVPLARSARRWRSPSRSC
ncbi:hypothetical protein ACU4GR_31555 [Methylobacterium oryzae CBMB20]